MNCKNCNTEITLKYCPNCGQSANLKRIDGHYMIHEIEHIFHFERGFLYTVKEILINPGQTVRNYILENRSRLVKPVIFIILTSLIYTLINHYFHIEEEYVKSEGLEKSTVGKILKWIQENYGYANILIGAFIALWLKVFFKKYGYNFFELLIMLCFVTGVAMLLFAFFAFIEGLFHFKLFLLAGIIAVLYSIWAIGNFFEKRKIGIYVKALISYFLGTITFYIIIFAIGLTIDSIIKH